MNNLKDGRVKLISLVGSTGFVGGNLAAKGAFDGLYHSTNIQEAFGTKPDLLYYAGLRAEKFLAEKEPEKDAESICEAQEIIRKIDPGRVVLISTVDVYEEAVQVTEESAADGQGAYGRNRAEMERWVRRTYPEHLIVRLPGLFGKGIKKNFIYDCIHYIPALLTPEKFEELSAEEPLLAGFYRQNDRGFFEYRNGSPEEERALRQCFQKLGFSALNFTDSRGVFQYYDLAHLFDDISAALAHDRKTMNLATEPVSSREIYTCLTGETFENHLQKDPPYYDFRTLYYRDRNGFPAKDGKGGYLYSKEEILMDIKSFAEKEMQL